MTLQKHLYKLVTLLLAILFLASVIPASAQGINPPVDPNGAWGQVVDPNGSINYSNLTDGGIVKQTESWMPDIPLIGPVQAEYHVYYTPSGNTVVMPTATTLFFMAANPQASGYNAAASTLGTNSTSVGVNAANGIAGLGAVFGALLNNPGSSQMMSAINQAGFNGPSSAQDFFQSVADGQTNIWSAFPDGLGNFLTSLGTTSLNDGNLYTYMLLYPPGSCSTAPGGCSPAQQALLDAQLPGLPPPPGNCPGSSVITGKITKNGNEFAPKYPIVVGQDPTRRGVDVSFSASVAPTIYTYYTQEPITQCVAGTNANGGSNCSTASGVGHREVTGWQCIKHTEVYPECISIASGTLKLSPDSVNWILDTLSIHLPGAYVHHPTFAFPASSKCSWSDTEKNIPIDDPGDWQIFVNGATSGTPVSGARSFGGKVGDFEVWLKEIAIVK